MDFLSVSVCICVLRSVSFSFSPSLELHKVMQRVIVTWLHIMHRWCNVMLLLYNQQRIFLGCTISLCPAAPMVLSFPSLISQTVPSLNYPKHTINHDPSLRYITDVCISLLGVSTRGQPSYPDSLATASNTRRASARLELKGLSSKPLWHIQRIQI